jgi:hypothetical protein
MEAAKLRAAAAPAPAAASTRGALLLGVAAAWTYPPAADEATSGCVESSGIAKPEVR